MQYHYKNNNDDNDDGDEIEYKINSLVINDHENNSSVSSQIIDKLDDDIGK